MEFSPLTAVSPIDGRYHNKTKVFSEYFSEYALFRYRTRVEIEYFVALCQLPLPGLEKIDASYFETLRKIYHNFSPADAQAIKEIEKTTNHDVKAVEYFIKDIFCDTIDINGVSKKDREHSKFLSYSGNQNNPPDFVIKEGDAVEVKKIENKIKGDIALNSSYPKSKLHNDDPRILPSCRDCDGGNWENKDIIYSIGSVYKGKIKVLWFVYGDCYAADREVYTRIHDKISGKIYEAEDIDFSETEELAGVKKVDPLGITYLRVRGMWGIKTPHSVFGNLVDYSEDNNFSAYALILEDKYRSFKEEDIGAIEAVAGENLKIADVEIKSPNNTAEYLKAKLISITK